MTLVPIKTEIFKATTPDFNHKAAQAAYDLVMKMDDDEAVLFVEMVASDIVEETIEKNLRTLQGNLDRVVAKRIDEVKRATLRTVSKANSPEALSFAAALAEISKMGASQRHGYVFDESDFRRSSDGRFTTKVRHTQKKPIDPRTAAATGIRGTDHPKYKSLPPEMKAQYQEEYRQLANFLENVRHSTVTPGDSDVYLHFRSKTADKDTGEVREWTEHHSGTNVDYTQLMRRDDKLIGIEARPGTLNIGGAYFGLSSSLGNGQGRPGLASGLNYMDQGGGSRFADAWTKETDPRNANERLYNKLTAGSQLAAGLSPDGSKREAAAKFGQFVGEHGAEAEKVFGPSTRKAAYRYRGTSKKPDREMLVAYNRAVHAEKMANAADPYRHTPEGRKANLKAPAALAPSQMAAQRVMAERRDPTWEERDAGRAVIATHLQKKMPKKGLYNLQLASGTTPPSEGVILDKNGKIVDQAIGYGDDHYLPFNLKNLKGLKGGEYIRTRSVGGLTSEDIYTGLISGARQVTVVSRSGTFTLTYDDDFKGGRRHNDKARRMTRRYEQILDAVQSRQVDRQDISPDIRAALVAQVKDKHSGWGLSSKQMNELIDQRITEFKESPDLSEDDEALASYMSRQMQIRADRGDMSQRDVDDFRNSVYSDLAAEKEYKFRLNGQGYADALEALREQFPYYITVKSIPRREERHEVELDRGYVEPGRNRPTAASAGLFGAATGHKYAGKGNKFSASEADYQGAKSGGPKGPAPEAGELKPIGDKKAGFTNVVEEQKKKATYVTAALALQEHARQNLEESDRGAVELGYLPADLADPEKQLKFDTWAQKYITAASRSNVMPADLRSNYMNAAGHIGQSEFDPEKAAVWPAKPFHFPTGNREKRLSEIDARTHGAVTQDRRLSELTDNELQAEHTALVQLKTALVGTESITDRVTLAETIGVKRGAPGLQNVMSDPKNLDDHIKAVHEVRALNQDTPDNERVAPIVVGHSKKTADEVTEQALGPRGSLGRLADNYTTAAEYFARHGLHDKADQLNNAAQGIHDALRGVVSVGDAEMLVEQNKDNTHLVLEYFEHLRTKTEVQTTGMEPPSGTILR